MPWRMVLTFFMIPFVLIGLGCLLRIYSFIGLFSRELSSRSVLPRLPGAKIQLIGLARASGDECSLAKFMEGRGGSHFTPGHEQLHR